MTLYVRDKSVRFDPIPQGEYLAICIAVVDIGTQENKSFGGETEQVLLQFELPECRVDIKKKDGSMLNVPRTIARRVTQSLDERSHLRKILESWRDKPFTAEELDKFDVENVLGAACMLDVVQRDSANGRTYSNIDEIRPVPEGIVPPAEPESALVSFSFEDAGDNPELPPGLPDWILELIKGSKEWDTRGFSKAMDEAEADDEEQSDDEESDGADNTPF